jgi:hypothetical protein
MTRCAAPDGGRHRERRPGRTTSARLGSGLLTAALALAACDFPTAPPVFEPRLVIPEAGTTLSVNQLLPASVTAVGTSFRIDVAQSTVHRTLAQMCGGPCTALAGQVAPKPAFADSFTLALALPADVQSVTLTSGAVVVNLSHSFGFDVLRPHGAATNGTATVTLRNAGRVLGTATIDQPFPSGTAITRTLVLAPGSLTGTIDVTVHLNSPAGGSVRIDPGTQFAVTATPQQIDVSQAAVRVQNRQVSAAAVTLDLTGIDNAVRNRVRSGAIVLTVDNPLNVAGTLQIQFQGTAVAPKTFHVAPGRSTRRIEFSQQEIRALLGHRVTVHIAGPVTGTATGGIITVTPGQQVTVETLLDLIIATRA